MTVSRHYQQALEIPIDSPPERVVSLVPSVTESLFDLNLGDHLVGRTDYCIYPAGQVDRVSAFGGTKNPDIERIIALKPDLVIMNQEENRRSDSDKLQAAGVPVWAPTPRTIPDVFNLLWNLMYLFEETSMVPRVRLIEQTYDWVSGIAKNRTPVRVFVPIWYDPLMTANEDTYIHHLLAAVGGENVFAQRQRLYPLAADLGKQAPSEQPGRDIRYPRVTMDEVVEAQPDVILLPDEPFTFTAEHLSVFQGLDIPAARNGRIYLVDGSYLTWHGTRIAYALDQLPAYFRFQSG